jgi:hypothetical protein
MKKLLFSICVVLFAFSCTKKSVIVSYPEKFEGLTQLVLASETKSLSFTDTTVCRVFGISLSSAQVQVFASVTYDFYLDFQADGYTMNFSETGDVLNFHAPKLRVKRPVINNTTVNYPQKGMFINEEAEAVKKLETLTDQFVPQGEALVKEQYVIDKCKEMLTNYLMDQCKKFNYPVKSVNIDFAQ